MLTLGAQVYDDYAEEQASVGLRSGESVMRRGALGIDSAAS